MSLSAAEVEAIEANMLYRQTKAALAEAGARLRGPVSYFGHVHPSIVPEVKRVAVDGVLTKLADAYGGHRPRLVWYSPLSKDETALIAKGAYPFKVFASDPDLLGFSTVGAHEIGLLVEQDMPSLLHTARHEYGHSLGIEDEAGADRFALEAA